MKRIASIACTDEKQEGVNGAKNNRLFGLTNRREADSNARSGCRFRSLLGKIDKGHVHDLGDRKTCPLAEGCGHAHQR